MSGMWNITDISRIGLVKRTGDEWVTFTKEFCIDEIPESAVVRAESDGVCGIYINDVFAEASTGRLPERVTCVEVTSLIKPGKNTITLRLGSHYFQTGARDIRERRGAWISFVAAQLQLKTSKGICNVVTDETWSTVSDDGATRPEVFSQITAIEYNQFWTHAALWREQQKIVAHQAVVDVAGKEYVDYISKEEPKYDVPVRINSTNMLIDGDIDVISRISDIAALYTFDENDLPFVVYDFGRLTVGYVEFEYESDVDGKAILEFDYSESTDDFKKGSRFAGVVNKLKVDIDMKKGKNVLRLIRRRAFRFMKITLTEQYRATKLRNVQVLRCIAPYSQLGWFKCDEEILNRAWEVGKYTVHVNKHQEYESCPRNEMKFFAGDGVVDALIDYYAFGDMELMDTSLSLRHNEVDNGIAVSPFNRIAGLWDYYAWRIIMTANHYRYSGDTEFVKRYFDELTMSLLWQIERIGKNGLIYQLPVWDGTSVSTSSSVEYTCSFDRLGEKPYLNALLYKSLIDMAMMADIVGDNRSGEWRELAAIVKKAFNERLWDEEKGAYIDTFDRSLIPQDGNALAVLFGLADPERAKRVFATIRKTNWSLYGSAIMDKEITHTRGGNKTISPAMNAHEAEARFRNGDAEGGMELIRRCWGTMLKKGAGTFWEFTPNNGTERWPIPAHAWSGGCCYLLSAFGLGVRPEEPGYETVVFEPYSGFDTFKGVIPTVKGLIAVSCETKADVRYYRIAVPKDVVVDVKIAATAKCEVIKY